MAAGFFSEPFQNTRIVETPFTEQSAAQSVCPGFANSPYLQRRPSRPNSLPRNWAGTRRMPPVLDLTQPAQGLKPSTFLPITIGVGSRWVLMRGSVAAMRKEQRSDGTTSGCDGDRRGGRGGTRDAGGRSMAAASGDDAVG